MCETTEGHFFCKVTPCSHQDKAPPLLLAAWLIPGVIPVGDILDLIRDEHLLVSSLIVLYSQRVARPSQHLLTGNQAVPVVLNFEGSLKGQNIKLHKEFNVLDVLSEDNICNLGRVSRA